jgi:hypothetical protein
MSKTLIVILITLMPAFAFAGKTRPQTTVSPISVGGNPAIRISEGGIFTTVVRTGSAANPVLAFHLGTCKGAFSCLKAHRGAGGILSVSAQGMHWQSDSTTTDTFDLPLSAARFTPCEHGYAICLDSSNQQRIFQIIEEDPGSAWASEDFYNTYYKFLIGAVQNFAGADAEFFTLRGEKPPQVAQPIDDAFRAQASAWRALAVKPDLPEEARKQRTLAESYLREKDFKGSIQHYELGVKAWPTWPEGWFNLAALYAETGEYGLAVDRMKHYLELTPDSPDAVTARDRIVVWEDKALKGKQ